ncbi:hypothetical protein OHA21_47130 [Actinoplanes sp. NBC_00393]|uniref:hypothetical protein n=1 Tax=Actinoplanes sp. NBC_00393 TaxID=2975953 RepID=UPI002E216AFD
MKDFLQRFWTWALSLAGVVGLYLGAAQLHWEPVFFIVVGVALALGAAPIAFKKIVDTATKLRDFSLLEQKASEGEQRVAKLTAELTQAEHRAKEIFLLGLKEGRAQALGALLSQEVPPPEIIGIAESQGQLAIFANFEPSGIVPQPGTRFLVVGQVADAIKGAVEVVHVDELRQVVHLSCIEDFSPKFWSHLRDRAPYDESAPSKVRLETYEVQDSYFPQLWQQVKALEIGEVADE